MKVGEKAQIKTFDGKVWNVEILHINTSSARVKVLDEDWKGNRIILRKLKRDFV